METTWIEEQRQKLKNTYDQCKNQEEPVLKAFSVYLLRILNGLSQIESSQLYGYEAQILEKAMRLFCIHYVEQAETVIQKETDIEDKKEIMKDIEDAISKISSVYKNVIDSTSNSDRQMFTSQAVETSIYDISPKLFATYSLVLETLVRLFHKETVYAFLLHPSLKSNVETASLFDMREKEGKVVLIYIPENEIEKIDQVPTYLLHEAFHVLTKDERNRKERSYRMELHLYNAVYQYIFQNINFDFIDEEEADEEIKKELMKRWFKIDERMEELKGKDKDERRFYSKNVLKEISKNWRKWLGDSFVTLGDDMHQVMNQILEVKECKYEQKLYSEVPRIEWEIQRKFVEILAGSLVERYADMYMTIYREAYADVACILTAGISPEAYEQAFRDSERVITEDILKKDTIRNLRIHVVAKAVTSCEGINHVEEWKKYSEEHDFRKMREIGGGIGGIGNGKTQNSRIQILNEDLKWFESGLKSCSQKLWGILSQKDSQFEKFRNIIEKMNLIEILNGKVNERLRTL